MNPEPLKDKLKNGHAPFASFMKDDIKSACDWLKQEIQKMYVVQNGLTTMPGTIMINNKIAEASSDVYK